MPTRAAPNQPSTLYAVRQNQRRFASVEAALGVATDLGVPGSIRNVHSTHPSRRRVPITKEIRS